jgi:GT2 family glycosyltransferase
MQFVVVIATIRQNLPGFDETMDRIRTTFVQPTEFHILDGSEGKAQALNKATEDLLAPATADCYVTMDDDIIPGADWQALVEEAFSALPKHGAFGLWMGDDAASRQVMGVHCLEEESAAGDLKYRTVIPPHHLNGGFIAYRTEVAKQIGKIPTEGVKYQLWEDAWRGRRVTKLGWEMAFLKGAEMTLVDYPDPANYIAAKEKAIEFGRLSSDRILRKSGVGDPLSVRVRKWLARARGRA